MQRMVRAWPLQRQPATRPLAGLHTECAGRCTHPPNRPPMRRVAYRMCWQAQLDCKLLCYTECAAPSVLHPVYAHPVYLQKVLLAVTVARVLVFFGIDHKERYKAIPTPFDLDHACPHKQQRGDIHRLKGKGWLSSRWVLKTRLGCRPCATLTKAA
eukprot:366462-Chlamydomonas_euryale.AAC.12